MDALSVLLDSKTHGIVALNKPAGRSSDEHTNDDMPAMETLMREMYTKHTLAHRIDKWTSGLLLFAESQTRNLQGQSTYFWLRNHWHAAVKKQYLAIMSAPTEETFFCDTPLFNEDKKRHQPCKTSFTVLDVNEDGWAIVLVDMVMGRKYQIRKHSQLLGLPLLGDIKFGGVATPYRNGQMLHAWRMEVQLPGRDILRLEAPIPDDFKKLKFNWENVK